MKSGSPGTFVVDHTKKPDFEKVGRARTEEGNLIVIIDGTGRYSLPVSAVTVLMEMGGSYEIPGDPVGICWRSERGRGFYFSFGKEVYVIPKRSLDPVLAGKGKAPVFLSRRDDNGFLPKTSNIR